MKKIIKQLKVNNFLKKNFFIDENFPFSKYAIFTIKKSFLLKNILFLENFLLKIKEKIYKINPHIQIEWNKIENHLYENEIISNNKFNFSEKKIPRKLQNDFLKETNYFFFQSQMLKKYLSVKYKFWEKNIKGKSIKVGLLDSGIENSNIQCNLVENINFTNETNYDFTGHGTFLASVRIYYLLRSFVVRS